MHLSVSFIIKILMTLTGYYGEKILLCKPAVTFGALSHDALASLGVVDPEQVENETSFIKPRIAGVFRS